MSAILFWPQCVNGYMTQEAVILKSLVDCSLTIEIVVLCTLLHMSVIYGESKVLTHML